AASLALTERAPTPQTEALRQALNDNDWQVRFHAVSALNAIGEFWALKGNPFHVTPGEIPFDNLGRQIPREKFHTITRGYLKKSVPNQYVLRAAGKLKDAEAIQPLV